MECVDLVASVFNNPENFLIVLIKLQKGTSGVVLGHHLLICDENIALLLCHMGNQQWRLHPGSPPSVPGMLQRGSGGVSGAALLPPGEERFQTL